MAILDSYNASMKVSVAEAKNKLPQLIKAVEQGKSVTIYRRGKPVADLIRTTKTNGDKRTVGILKDKVIVNDPDWWKPMTDEEVEGFIEGRD
jgi:prevent-host-death family protein